ncbi:gamma-glutamylcyclotransferase [Cyanosarcina cf. burmensis CCALA 770]|nr:gamma-glutamylcyclotransferase [Cyanosarcina cf. burmensis CCALA 770]
MSGLGQLQDWVASTDETIGKTAIGNAYLSQQQQREPMFYYFAYGSCMCPVDLKRSLGEKTHVYALGPATLKGYRLGFYSYSPLRNSGVLDVVPDKTASVEGVLYMLPKRLSQALDRREGVAENWYRHERISVHSRERLYKGVRTYVVVNKLATEMPPNDWYFDVVLRGAVTCGLSEKYCWQLFDRMYQLQRQAVIGNW